MSVQFVSSFYLKIRNYKLKIVIAKQSFGPIVYRLGHRLFKAGSGVRLSVGSHKGMILLFSEQRLILSLFLNVF